MILNSPFTKTLCIDFPPLPLWNSLSELSVTWVYVPWFFVSSQQRFGATDIKALGASQVSWTKHVIALRQISVTALFYLEDSRRTHPQSVRACQPKDLKGREWRSAWGRGRETEGERKSSRTHVGEKEREKALWLLFLYVFVPPPGPALCKLGLARSAVFSTWSLHSGPRTFLVFLATAILDSFSLFYLPNISEMLCPRLQSSFCPK